MGANFGTGDDKRNVNIEMNLVPFIDLMSCLTAFLLLTAVWVNIAQVNTRPVGRRADVFDVVPPREATLSVLVDAEGIWVGESTSGQIQHIVGHDWFALNATLAAHKSDLFVDRADLQLAAESIKGREVLYQDLITAMDVAHQVGFVDVGLTDPKGLETRPML
jgi:biopolymer transport protein ExbD